MDDRQEDKKGEVRMVFDSDLAPMYPLEAIRETAMTLDKLQDGEPVRANMVETIFDFPSDTKR